MGSDAAMSGEQHSTRDALLVARIRTGDDDAFAELVGIFQAPLYRYLLGVVGDAEQAHDLLQETFLRAFRSMNTLAEPHLLRSWLYTIAHNQAISYVRKARLINLIPRFTPAQPTLDRRAIESLRVTAALKHVPAELRSPLLLHLVAGFSYAEIAALLGISEGAVRMRISRGRAAFRAAYGPEDDDAP